MKHVHMYSTLVIPTRTVRTVHVHTFCMFHECSCDSQLFGDVVPTLYTNQCTELVYTMYVRIWQHTVPVGASLVWRVLPHSVM